jgi:YD repeat-containing protein
LEDTRYFAYDAVGNLVGKIDRNGRETEFLYDNLHRRIEETWLDGQTVVRTIEYEWDAANQLLSVDDADADYEYAYNQLGQVTQIMADVGSIVVLTQAFDAAGNRTSLAVEIDSVDDFLNAYTFDALGQITRITQAGQVGGNTIAEKRVDLSYLADGPLDVIARYKDLDGGSGNLVGDSQYSYDGMGRIAELEHSDGVTVINAYAWAYDANSRVTEVESIDGTSAYSYDNTGQVIDVDHSYQADEDFSFDENGNRTMAGYVFGDNNQLLSDGTWDYLYDGEGNTVRKTRISEDPADDHRIDYNGTIATG